MKATDARIIDALKQAGYKIFSIQPTIPGTDDVDIISVATAKRGLYFN